MKLFKLIILFALLVFFSGCDRGGDVPVVKIGHAPHDHHSPLYIAAVKQDYFKPVGQGVYMKEIMYKKQYALYEGDKLLAKVEIDSGTGGMHLIRKLDEKILDVSFGGVPAMIEMIDQGSSIKIIAPVMSEGAGLVVNRSIPVENWDEFVGYVKASAKPVRIGYKVDRSVQNLIFESALLSEQLTFSRDISATNVDVVVINLHGPKNLQPSMEAGVIDGFVVMQPYPALAEHAKSGKIISLLHSLPPHGKWDSHPCCALAAGGDFIKNHGEILTALVELFQEASDFIKENPDESAHIVSAWLDTPYEVEKMSLPTIKFMKEYNNSWNVGVQYWVGYLIDRGYLTGEVKKAVMSNTINNVIYDNRFYDKANMNKR